MLTKIIYLLYNNDITMITTKTNFKIIIIKNEFKVK